MYKLYIVGSLIICIVIGVISAYPSRFNRQYEDESYESTYYGAQSYLSNFEPQYPPRFGSGYDKYIYGYYEDHPGPYDNYSNQYKKRNVNYGHNQHTSSYMRRYR